MYTWRRLFNLSKKGEPCANLQTNRLQGYQKNFFLLSHETYFPILLIGIILALGIQPVNGQYITIHGLIIIVNKENVFQSCSLGPFHRSMMTWFRWMHNYISDCNIKFQLMRKIEIQRRNLLHSYYRKEYSFEVLAFENLWNGRFGNLSEKRVGVETRS